jgi:hypothetical protein
MPKCTQCKAEKPDTEFNRRKDGVLRKTCLTCTEERRVRRERTKCVHGKQPRVCIICDGRGLCEHGRQKHTCKPCGGASVCEHGRLRHLCRDCGGTTICEHGKQRPLCVKCKGVAVCEHGKVKADCPACRPASVAKSRMLAAFRLYIHGEAQNSKHFGPNTHIGCSLQEFRDHLEAQFKPGMTWENHGEWEIDHIVPVRYGNPTLEEQFARLHFTNTQPLWKIENRIKGCRLPSDVPLSDSGESESS